MGDRLWPCKFGIVADKMMSRRSSISSSSPMSGWKGLWLEESRDLDRLRLDELIVYVGMHSFVGRVNQLPKYEICAGREVAIPYGDMIPN